MIRIRRPKTEPLPLAKQRRAGLKRAFAALNAHGAGSKQLKDALTGYDGGKEALFKAQHKKCAFCERRVGFPANALEHFRPKREAWRHLPGATPKIVDSVGYWWLTWAWVNQLFACVSCNTGYKQNYFPLAAGSKTLAGPSAPYTLKRLRASHVDVSVESPLLLDPAAEDPLDHIEWRPVNPAQPKRLWKWYPTHLTPKGEATIKVLRLVALADDVGDHLRDNVLWRTERVCEHIDTGQHTLAVKEWGAIVTDLACSKCHLAGPTWNALHYLVDPVRRATAKLPIPPRP